MKGKQESKPKYLPATDEIIESYETNEKSKLATANAARQKHKYDKSTRWFINPARYHYQIKESKANKDTDANIRNLTQLGDAEKTGFVRIGKSPSGRKDHITAIDRETYFENTPVHHYV